MIDFTLLCLTFEERRNWWFSLFSFSIGPYIFNLFWLSYYEGEWDVDVLFIQGLVELYRDWRLPNV